MPPYCAPMSWASEPTDEMPTSPRFHTGRHRPGRRILLAMGVLAGLLLIGAIGGPSLLGPSPTSGTAAKGPAPTAPGSASTTEGSDPTASAGAPAAPTPAASTVISATSPAATPTGSPSLEAQVFSLTNSERAKNGCPALRLDASLTSAARQHSADMARTGVFSHTGTDGSDPGDRMRSAGYDTSRGWAENIAWGQPSAQAVMSAWLGSSGHRANILNCSLRALGVGVARNTAGRIYWTQDFGGR
jgi:uncharacterized protein YkwD